MRMFDSEGFLRQLRSEEGCLIYAVSFDFLITYVSFRFRLCPLLLSFGRAVN